MAVTFQSVSFPPLAGLTVSAPDGALIGIVGDEDSGARDLLRLAGGLASPMEGDIKTPATRRILDAASVLDLSPAGLLLLDHALSRRDAFTRARAAMEFVHLRRGGVTILLASHELDLLKSLADEIWWLDKGKLAAKGDPAEVLEKYRAHTTGRLRDWGSGRSSPLSPPLRRGDGRADLVSVETLDEHGAPTMTWRSGESVGVRVTVRYREAVDNPVVGIMIRTRIGFEVYGTNTELEKLRLGPRAAGDVLRVLFRFKCDLCPREYTLTAASHDPDGTLHEWLEDALAFLVVDSRFTAGVANLRAEVIVDRGM